MKAERRDLQWHLRNMADRVEKHALYGVAFFAALYTVAMLHFASVQLLWLDEISTFYISRLWPPGRIIEALKNYADA